MGDDLVNNGLFIEILGIMTLPEKVVKLYGTTVSVNLKGSGFIIGSRLTPPPCPDVIINEPGVSRRHASIYCAENIWYIEDFGSDNGTWIIGEELLTPIKGKTPIYFKDPQSFLFGTVVLRLSPLHMAAD